MRTRQAEGLRWLVSPSACSIHASTHRERVCCSQNGGQGSPRVLASMPRSAYQGVRLVSALLQGQGEVPPSPKGPPQAWAPALENPSPTGQSRLETKPHSFGLKPPTWGSSRSQHTCAPQSLSPGRRGKWKPTAQLQRRRRYGRGVDDVPTAVCFPLVLGWHESHSLKSRKREASPQPCWLTKVPGQIPTICKSGKNTASK